MEKTIIDNIGRKWIVDSKDGKTGITDYYKIHCGNLKARFENMTQEIHDYSYQLIGISKDHI